MYERFAEVYDSLMNDVDYAAWAAHYASMFEASGIAPHRVLDCACGTGGMTFALYGLGYQMTASDISIEMLSRASDKARRMGIALPFIKQDMRCLKAHKPMDAIVCACDGVNYLLKPSHVEGFMKSARETLRKGGGLFFDVSSAYKLSTVVGDQTFGEDRDSLCYLWQNNYDKETKRSIMELTFFLKADGDKGELYECFRETHVQRAYEVDEILSMLKVSGFRDIRAYGGMSLSAPTDVSERIHFAAIAP